MDAQSTTHNTRTQTLKDKKTPDAPISFAAKVEQHTADSLQFVALRAAAFDANGLQILKSGLHILDVAHALPSGLFEILKMAPFSESHYVGGPTTTTTTKACPMNYRFTVYM